MDPYLQAIQRIPGEVLDDKRKTLYLMAQQKILEWNRKDPIKVFPSPQLPELLVPWITLEIGRILKQDDAIFIGLASTNQSMVSRALKTKWFFKGIATTGNPKIQEMQTAFFPYISLRNRAKVIKILAANMKTPEIAELFHGGITELYGFNQARPFLKACSESFIWNCIKNYRIRLTLKEMIHIYYKNPSFIIEYLNLPSDDDFNYENLCESNPRYIPDANVNLRKFLPKLIKNHSADFVRLVQKYGDLGISLNNTKTFLFIKHQRSTLLDNPRLYFPMLSLKRVTYLLTRSELKIVLQNLFATNPEEFRFTEVYMVLKFLPEMEKISLILEAFRDTYSQELTDFYHCVVSAIRYLPLEERERQVQRLMFNDHNWGVQSQINIDMWRCYLLLEKSAPMILYDIRAYRTSHQKLRFFQQLVITCRVNDDFDTLLFLLENLLDDHKNMEEWVWVKIFDEITKEFDVKSYISLYWQRLYGIILVLNVRTGTYDSVENIWNIVTWGIQVDLERNYNIKEKIMVLTEINERNRIKPIWNICKHNVFFEKICLTEFLEAIFLVYPKQRERNTEVWKNAIISLVTAMYNFNYRHSKYKEMVEKFLVSEVPELLRSVNAILLDYFSRTDNFDCKGLITLLEINEEEDILEDFMGLTELYDISRAMLYLKGDLDKIADRWEMYYELCKQNITKKSSRLFLRNVRWSYDLPRLFVNKCLAEIRANFDIRSIKMLAMLLDNTDFKRIIDECLRQIPTGPSPEMIAPSSNIPRVHYPIFLRISEAVKYMNSPLRLEWIKKICDSKCKPIIAECVTALEKRTPAYLLVIFSGLFPTIFNFVFKYIVKVFQNTAETSELQDLLFKLWNNRRNNVEIRKYLIKNIHRAFTTRQHLNGPNQTSIFLEKLPDMILYHWLNDININNGEIKKLIIHFINCYITPVGESMLQNRLHFFSGLFRRMLTHYAREFNNQNKTSNFIFVNTFLHEFVNYVVFEMPFNKTKKLLIDSALESFLAELTPQHNMEFYCYFKLTNLFGEQITSKQLVDEIDRILLIFVENFSSSCLHVIASYLYNLIKLVCFDESPLLDVIEGLIECGKRENTFLATCLLSYMTKLDPSQYERFWQILNYLKNHDDMLIALTANQGANSINAGNITFN